MRGFERLCRSLLLIGFGIFIAWVWSSPGSSEFWVDMKNTFCDTHINNTFTPPNLIERKIK